MQATVIRPEQALRDYISAAGCEVFEPSADGYAPAARRNGAVHHKPALVARCLTTVDIQLSWTAVEVTSDGNT